MVPVSGNGVAPVGNFALKAVAVNTTNGAVPKNALVRFIYRDASPDGKAMLPDIAANSAAAVAYAVGSAPIIAVYIACCASLNATGYVVPPSSWYA
jgi:hypothetical protein